MDRAAGREKITIIKVIIAGIYQQKGIRSIRIRKKQKKRWKEDKKMIQPIMKDVLFLTQKSEPAKRSDWQAAQIIQHEIDHCDGIII